MEVKARFRIQWLAQIPEGFYLRCLNWEAYHLMLQHPGRWYTPYKPKK